MFPSFIILQRILSVKDRLTPKIYEILLGKKLFNLQERKFVVSILPLSSLENHTVGEGRCSFTFSKSNCISVEFAKSCGYLVYVLSYVGCVGTWVEWVKWIEWFYQIKFWVGLKFNVGQSMYAQIWIFVLKLLYLCIPEIIFSQKETKQNIGEIFYNC